MSVGPRLPPLKKKRKKKHNLPNRPNLTKSRESNVSERPKLKGVKMTNAKALGRHLAMNPKSKFGVQAPVVNLGMTDHRVKRVPVYDENHRMKEVLVLLLVLNVKRKGGLGAAKMLEMGPKKKILLDKN
jgi:hypothetical protein